MLSLKATAEARAGLRSLRDSNGELFTTVSDRIAAIRRDPGGRAQGRAFRLNDGRTARLATYYDLVAQRDLVLVWLIAEGDDGGELQVIAAEHAS